MCDSCRCFKCLFAVAAGSMIQVRSDDSHWNFFGWSTGEQHVQLLARETNTRSVSRAAPGAPLNPCTGQNWTPHLVKTKLPWGRVLMAWIPYEQDSPASGA